MYDDMSDEDMLELDQYSSANNFSLLSDDIMGEVFSFLETTNQIASSRVCQRWWSLMYSYIHSVQFDSIAFGRASYDPSTIAVLLSRYHLLYELDIVNGAGILDDHLQPIFDRFANEFQTIEIRNSNLVNPRFSCPRLKELRILKCPTLSGVRLEGCSSLTELDFGMSMILERHLEVCLNDLMQAQAPLTVLKLNSCKNLAKFTIPNFPKLRQLDLQRTNVYDQALADILSLLPNLTHLNVNYCIGLKNVRITDHPSLESISFSQCIHIFKIRIIGCSRLREIDVSATALVVQELENLIRSNPQVLKWNFNRAYKFSNINLSQDSSEDEGKLMRLDTECFDCSYTEANDNSIDQITCASAGLKQLYLNQTSIVRPRIYSFSLQVLHLQGTSITGDILCDIVNHCPSLTTLDVQQCEGIANLGTLQLNSLERFNISSVPIEDQAFQVILSQCPKLKSLEVAGCNGLTNIHLKHGSLEFLSVQRCMALAGLEISRETCPHLKLVDASSCEQLSSMRVRGYDKIYCETEKVKVHPGQGELKIITNNRNQQRMTVIQQ